jgi:hypothetical protein
LSEFFAYHHRDINETRNTLAAERRRFAEGIPVLSTPYSPAIEWALVERERLSQNDVRTTDSE